MSGAPLAGLRVLRLGGGYAAGVATLLLADLGADAVHALPCLNGAPPAGRATLTRGGQLLDLDALDARKRVRALACEADVVIDDGACGLLDHLALAPSLIRGSLPVFADDDARGGGHQALDEASLAAAAGLFWDPEGGAPIPTRLPLAGTFAGIAGAVAIAAALADRERTGVGQAVEVAQADAALLAIGAQGLFVDGRPGGNRPDDPWSGCFKTADGRWAMVCLTAPRFQDRFLAAAAVEEWRDLGYLDLLRNAPGTPLRAEHQAALEAVFASHDAAWWEQAAGEAAFPLTMVRTRAEWVADDQARAARLVVEVDDPLCGAMLQAGPAVRVGEGAAMRARRVTEAPAWSGERWALREAAGEPSGAPALDGVRVLDLTQVLAGPVVARTLAELGAEVVKVNDPNERGPGWSWSELRYHTDVNRGKSTLLLDLKRPEGREALRAVAGEPDVVLQNFRPGVAERLGVGPADLAARWPGAVLGQVSAFGVGGPWYGRPGYESDAQAVSGMAGRDGGFGEPAFETLTINDYATGLLGALGVITALVDRARTGRVRPVHAALAATASTLQLALLERRAGEGDPETEPLAERVVAASNGWVFLPAGAVPPADDLDADLDRDTLVERLRRAGIVAQPIRSHREVMEDPRAIRRGFSITRPNARGALVTTIGPVFRMSRSAVLPGRLVSRPGHDAAELFGAAGLGERLPELLAAGVVGEAM